MKKRLKAPPVPRERRETVRREIIALLEGQSFSAKEISGSVGISEKEIYAHLEHIGKTLERGNHQLVVDPAVCKKCGFIFKKREKMKKPGKCPLCRGESIEDPLFSMT